MNSISQLSHLLFAIQKGKQPKNGGEEKVVNSPY